MTIRISLISGALLAFASVLTACGTVKEKTAPCKRPANLSSFVEDPRQSCGAMQVVNDPAAAFAVLDATRTP